MLYKHVFETNRCNFYDKNVDFNSFTQLKLVLLKTDYV